MSDFLKSQAERNQETAERGPQDSPQDEKMKFTKGPVPGETEHSTLEQEKEDLRRATDPTIHPDPSQAKSGFQPPSEQEMENAPLAQTKEKSPEQEALHAAHEAKKDQLDKDLKEDKDILDDELTEDEKLLQRLDQLEQENRALKVKVQNQQARINKISQIGRR